MRWISPKAFVQKDVMILLAGCLLMALPALGDYELSWYTIGGGGQSSGGSYILTGTIGQPDVDWSKGGDYELLGGFWPGIFSHLFCLFGRDHYNGVAIGDNDVARLEAA